MAVTIVEERPQRDGSLSTSEIEYTRTFQVKTDATDYNVWSIYLDTAGQIPRYLDPHPDNIFARLKRIAAKPPTETTKYWWILTCHYDSQPLTTDDREKTKEPLERAAKIVWKTAHYTEPLFRDRNGTPIVNAVGDYYDPPPERDAFYPVASVTKNLPAVPIWLTDYENTINQSSFKIDGLNVLPGCARLTNLTVSEQLEENNQKFRRVAFDIEFRKPPDLKENKVYDAKTRKEVTKLAGWDLVVLNQGMRAYIDVEKPSRIKNATDSQNKQATSPVLLDKDGLQIQSPLPADAVYFRHEIYPTKDFGALPLT